MNGDFRKCGKPDCFRKVAGGALYCCPQCVQAAGGRYEIHAHAASCDMRAAERGEFSPAGPPQDGDFYEEDEPLGKLRAAYAAGLKGVTRAPEVPR